VKLKIKTLREKRRKHTPAQVYCPKCSIEMKRKGKKGQSIYFKCPKCKSKWIGGEFVEPSPERAEERNLLLKAQRREQSIRKLIRRLKKQKYLPFKTLEFAGKIINLDEYDKDGLPLKPQEQRTETKEGTPQEG